MADMLDPQRQDSEISDDTDTEINVTVQEKNAIMDGGGKMVLKGKSFEFLTVDFNQDDSCQSTKTKQGNKKKKTNLQESFLKFKKQKQKDILRKRRLKELRKRHRADPSHADRLRQKFVNQAKKYFGVPYARKYWPPDSLEYKSPLFLDCCALVRQVLRDLEDDFGFRIGPWNQAYMFDTLPIKIERERDMKPGDLVFMSGIYHNKKRQQKHHMTHVEIWAGDGNKTIGARWNNGKVQVFDSYRFDAKSFHSTEYHFRSIDTWLNGTCKSFCPTHRWKKSKFSPKKKSVFNMEKQIQQEQEQQQQQDEAAGDSSDENDDANSRPDTSLSRDTPLPPRSCDTPLNADSLILVQKSEGENGEKFFDIEKTYASKENLKNFKVSTLPESMKMEPKKSDKFLNLSALGSTLEETSRSYLKINHCASLNDIENGYTKQESARILKKQNGRQEFDNICRSAEPSPDFSLCSDDYLDDKYQTSGSSSPVLPRSKTEISFYSRQSTDDSIGQGHFRPLSALSSSGADDE